MTRDFIVKGIQAGKPEYREGAGAINEEIAENSKKLTALEARKAEE